MRRLLGRAACASRAGYYDICEERRSFFSPYGELDVSTVDLMEVGGRQAPALRIACTDEGGVPCEFALIVEFARRFNEEQLDQLREAGLDVLSLDLRGVYAGMRDAEGRHFSRGEFFMRAQGLDFIQGVLSGGEGSEALRRTVHRRRDAVEEEADARYREKQRERMREYERELEQMLALMEADMQREREEAERLRAEEARRKAEMRESAIEAERRAFEREGVEALLKVRHGVNFYIDDCPLLEQADVVADCGAYVWSPDKCIFFEGQRYYLIGCTARQNGVSLND